MHNLREKGEEVDCQLYSRRICGSSQGRRSSSQLLLHPNYCSLAEAQGCIYSLAKDHNGCRFLQRMFEDVALLLNDEILIFFSNWAFTIISPSFFRWGCLVV